MKTATQIGTSESAVRQKAKRRGLMLRKARVRHPQIPWLGTYCVIDPYRNMIVYGDSNQGGFGMALEDCDEFISNWE